MAAHHGEQRRWHRLDRGGWRAPLANKITIDAGGNVILNAGTPEGSGVRIGSSANTGGALGDININAGGSIELNGSAQPAAIRNTGNVTLEAASISEASTA